MTYRYKTVKRKNYIQPTKPAKYYASPVHGGEISFEHVVDNIVARSSFSGGDVSGLISELVQELSLWLPQGCTVNLGKLGIFSLSITSPGFDKPKDCLPGRVRPNKICYQASVPFKNKIGEAVKFERM